MPVLIEKITKNLLNVPINVKSFVNAIGHVMAWGHAYDSRYVVLANVHVVTGYARQTLAQQWQPLTWIPIDLTLTERAGLR